MPTATVTSKGQITIPLEVRERLGIEAGTKCLFVVLDDGRAELIPKRDDLMSLAGMLHRAPPPETDDYDSAMKRYWDDEDTRIRQESGNGDIDPQ